MVKEEGVSKGVVEPTPIVALHVLDSTARLSHHIRKKKRDKVENFSDLGRSGNIHKWQDCVDYRALND